MKWITFLLLSIVAIVAALFILVRVRRGKPIVLSGRWSPRLVRMIVVVLVVIGMGEQATTPEAAAAPVKLPIRGVDDQLPPSFKPYSLQAWLMYHQRGSNFQTGWPELLQALAGKRLDEKSLALAKQFAGSLGNPTKKIVLGELEANLKHQPVPIVTGKELKVALNDLEHAGRFNHLLNAYLWRRSENATFVDAAERIELYARFRQHARITDALLRAHAQVKPLMQSPRAWMSKAGPRGNDLVVIKAYNDKIADMVKTTNELLPSTDEGTWKRDGIVLIKPIANAPMLIRGGKESGIPADNQTRFGRLDLLKTGDKPAEIEAVGLGKITLPANSLTSVWELPDLLSDEAKKKLDGLVLDALKNDSEESAETLERLLAISHRAIRTGLVELPKAKGGPRLRLILSLFDDSPMPMLKDFHNAKEMESQNSIRAGGRGRR